MSFHNTKWAFALCVGFIVLMLLIPSALALPGYQEIIVPCVGSPECYEEIPTPAPFPIFQPQTSWGGYSDGRLSPAMDEYYSVWCQNTFLEIWRGAPTGTLLSMLPIWLLEGLGERGDTVMAADFGDDPGIHPLTITRNGDTLTISGDNGNLTPQSGSKSFSLNDCIARDGHTAEERGSAQAQSGFVFDSTTATTCYGPNSPYVLRGQVPADQICQEQGVTAVGP